MARRPEGGEELSDGRVIEPETATEGSDFVKDQKTNIAAELEAGGGPVNGWESIWAAGLQPGQVTNALLTTEIPLRYCPACACFRLRRGTPAIEPEMRDWGARCCSVKVAHVAHVR